MKIYLDKLKRGGIIHFSGIGGIGMSGIAEVLHDLGYNVQGSDSVLDNANIVRLRNKNIRILPHQDGRGLSDIDLFVKSTAIKEKNPEVKYCRGNGITVISRGQMLAELMVGKTAIAVSGTHGKTTTTSLIASMLESLELNPTVINGGVINGQDTNAYLGTGDLLVAEADESDETFVKIPSTIGVITNIDPEHLDHYGSFEKLKSSFESFINNLPSNGYGVLCIDHPEVRNLLSKLKNTVLTYGIDSPDADVRAINIKQLTYGFEFDVKIGARHGKKTLITGVKLGVPGIHNVLNSLSAIAIAYRMGFESTEISKGFAKFKGVQRRFTLAGEVDGVKFIDDYAHHPEEIKAVLKTARQCVGESGKIIAIFQPHRYTRLRDLFEDFTNSFIDANMVIISDVYEAGETPIEGISGSKLAGKIAKLGFHESVKFCASENEIISSLKSCSAPGDIVIFLGAGNITKWAHNAPKVLRH